MCKQPDSDICYTGRSTSCCNGKAGMATMLAVTALLVACASQQPVTKSQEAPASSQLQKPLFLPLFLPPQRIARQGYSLLPPNERGWDEHQNQYKLTLRRYGINPDETYVISGHAFQLSKFRSVEDLARLMAERQKADGHSGRFNLLRHEVVPDSSKQTECVRAYMAAEDKKAAKRTSRTGTMILEIIALTCAHPSNKTVAIEVTYSHRHYAGQEDPDLTEKATQLFSTIELSP